MKENLGKDYTVLDPRYMYLGKSYSDYTTDWFNWFLSSNADKRNSGPVVFLRSKPIPDRTTQVYNLDVSAKTINASFAYVNEPNIRIGANKLEIFADQAVFVPIIVAYHYSSEDRRQDWGELQEGCGILIDNGDNPPDLIQLTINNDTLILPEDLPGGGEDFSDFRITTPIFMAVVPDAPYGTSVKDFLEEGPVAPGSYPAMITGYFVMLKFKLGSYWIHSWASAGRELSGPYFSEFLYQIDVLPRPKCVPHHRITVRPPAHFKGIVNRVFKEMTEAGQLTDHEIEFFEQIRQESNKRFKQIQEELSL